MSLLVVGSGSVRQLLAWLERYDEICKVSGDTTCVQPNDSYSLLNYCLSTKYYDATLRVTGFDLDDSNAEIIKEMVTTSEGLIVVVDKSCIADGDQSARSALLALGESAGSSGGVAVQLLLDVGAATSSEDSDSTNSLLEWSLDHSFEYIAIDPSRLAETCDSREKDGLPRLVEALQSAMWSTLIRKAAVSTAATVSSASASAPDPVASVPAAGTEDILDEFSDLIDRARQFHATAKAGGMSDEERKRVAAETALRLASLLGLDDDDDDDA